MEMTGGRQRAGKDGAETAPRDVAVPGVLPIFPLPGTVLLPGEVLPLHVFEPRYLDLVRDALAGHRIFGVVAIRPGFEGEQLGAPPVETVGCAGLVIRHLELPGGRCLVWLLGVNRFTIREELPALTPYRQVRIDLEPGPRPAGVGRPETDGLRLDLLAALPLLIDGGFRKVQPLTQFLARLDDDQLAAGLAHLLEVGSQTRQQMLEAPSAAARLRLLKDEVDLRFKLHPPRSTPEPSELN